jgi:hypothetical protein
MNITTHFKPIGITIYQQRLVTTLKHMSPAFAAMIVPHTVTGQESLHEAAKVCHGRAHKKMDVCVHEGVSMNLYREKSGRRFQSFEKILRFDLILKNDSSVVPSCDDVIPETITFDAEWSRHALL